MRNTRRIRQSWRYGAVAFGGALTLACAALTVSPAGASSGQPVRPGLPTRPGMLFPGSSELRSVFCTSRTNCWAVGLHVPKADVVVNEIVHWNGKKWSKVSAPSPGGNQAGDFTTLSAVRCASATNCWAVGQDFNRGQALHWNGTKWSLVSTPEPGHGMFGYTELRDVACPSADSCWAAGLYGHDSSTSEYSLNLALHWNGKKWFKVTTPNPAGTTTNDLNDLFAIRCASIDDCWAAGTEGVSSTTSNVQLNQMLHWNGRKWFTQTVPSPAGSTMGSHSEIFSLSCTSPDSCWAVGDYGALGASDYDLNQALHWNGHKWSTITTPDPDGTAVGASNTLSAVTCAAKNDCWAVGLADDSNLGGDQTGQALHWNGTKWRVTAIPNPAGTTNQATDSLDSVRCITVKDCWIVGSDDVIGHPQANLFAHWNGTKWSAS